MKRLFRTWTSLSLANRILVGLALGVLAGLFFGEAAGILQPVADIFVRLLQMTVLPYLVSALILAFGQLGAAEAKRLALRAGALLLTVWGMTGLVIMATPQTFPAYESAAFFSRALVEPAEPFSLTDVFFTANPFKSLAENIVPAVVLFSTLLGIGVMGLKDKEHLLAPLRVINDGIVRVTGFVIALTPLGVFALAAIAAGTLDPDTLLRLEVYFIAFSVVALLLAFWLLPQLVTAVTPFRYGEVSDLARGALLTAFMTSNAFIVLPMLVEGTKTLLERRGLLNPRSASAAEVLVPVLFIFPNAGKLLPLLFVPFAAWLSGAPLGAADLGELVAVGIPSFFAKATVAMPFLLDVFELPHDLFHLFVPTSIITGKFDSLVTAANLLVVGLLGAVAMGGGLEWRSGRLLRAVLAIAGGLVVTMFLMRLALATLIDTDYRLDETVRAMKRATNTGAAIVHREPPARPGTNRPNAAATLEQIRARGTLRVGYDPENLPFSYFNAAGELVGFDVELAAQLAAALDLVPEFVPIRWPVLPDMLARGDIDLMPGVWYRPIWFSKLQLSQPYLTGTIGFAVRDERRHDFASVSKLQASHGLTIGVPLNARQLEGSLRRYFGDAQIELVTVEFWDAFFEGKHPEIDAFLMPAEHAAAWTLLHPEYAVVVPQPDPVEVPSAFGIALAADGLLRVVDEWVVYARHSGAMDREYDYWILGQGAKRRTPRWSIMRNVLGWGDLSP